MGEARPERQGVTGDRYDCNPARVPDPVVSGLSEVAQERPGSGGVTDPTYGTSPAASPRGQSQREAL